MDGVSSPVVNKQSNMDGFRKTRWRKPELFTLLALEAYYEEPIKLRHPGVFDEGHVSACSVNTLVNDWNGRWPISLWSWLTFQRPYSISRHAPWRDAWGTKPPTRIGSSVSSRGVLATEP